jgi:hypothetical protein
MTPDDNNIPKATPVQPIVYTPPPTPPPKSVQTSQWWQGAAIVTGAATILTTVVHTIGYQLPSIETNTFVGALFTMAAAGVAMYLGTTPVKKP